MKSFRNILLAALAILFLNSGLDAANVPLAETPEPEQGHYFKNIQIVKDMKTFKEQNPHLRLIRLEKKTINNLRSESVKYSLGSRVAGDHMVAQYADTFYYSSPEDVSKQVIHPETGTGSLVTYVDINCLQDNAEGNAYVVDGGIGKPFISIVVEAVHTKRFTYNVHVYGTE